MKQHRTKEQKLRAEERRTAQIQMQYSFRDQSDKSSGKNSDFQPQKLPEKRDFVKDSVAALFPYDTVLIYHDLQKTAVIVAILFCVLFSAYAAIMHFS